MPIRIFGRQLGKVQIEPFEQFRDAVRLAIRKAWPGAVFELTEDGITLTLGQTPLQCNLRNVYAAYVRDPAARSTLIEEWLDSLVTPIPDVDWLEAAPTLRPLLKSRDYLSQAHNALAHNDPPDALPFQQFAGGLGVIVVRDIAKSAVAVTASQLASWKQDFHSALGEALTNVNMLTFPPVTSTLMAGPSSEEVGLVFEGDHLTATWLIVARFRDYVAQRLQGDFVVYVPGRERLIAVRADEPALIQSYAAEAARMSAPYPLTANAFHVSMAATGGHVTQQTDGSTKSAPDAREAGWAGLSEPTVKPR